MRLLTIALLATACSPEADTPDAQDVGSDVGAFDAGGSDATSPDASDASAADAQPDGGRPHACIPDASPPDDAGNAGSDAGDAGLPSGTAILLTPLIDFGVRIAGHQTHPGSVAIENQGVDAAAVLIAPLAGEFRLADPNQLLVIVAPGAMETIALLYDPRTIGAASSTLTLDLCGGGCPAEVALTAVATDGPLSCDDASISTRFPCFVSTGIQCANLTDDTVDLERMYFEGYFIVSDFIARTSPPGDVFSVGVESNSEHDGIFETDLIVEYGPSHAVQRAGGGFLRCVHEEPHCELLVGRNAVLPTLQLGATLIGQTVRGTLGITNAGFDACTLDPMVLPNTDPAFTLVSPTSMVSLTPGASLDVEVDFQPPAEATYGGTIEMSVSPFREGVPQTLIELAGTGASQRPTYAITRASVPFAPLRGAFFGGRRDIPFPFEFAGAPVSELYDEEGQIRFTDQSPPDPTNQALPDPAEPNGLLAWWWGAAVHGRGSRRPVPTSTVTGRAPRRVLHLLLPNFRETPYTDVTVSAEIRLHEESNVIEVHYGPSPICSPDGRASAGWEDFLGVDGADALDCGNECNTADWPANTVITYTP